MLLIEKLITTQAKKIEVYDMCEGVIYETDNKYYLYNTKVSERKITAMGCDNEHLLLVEVR